MAPNTLTVFLVHGRDDALKYEVAYFIRQTLGSRVSVDILHEKPNAGRTLIEKFESHAHNADFAVVLLTPDDQGGLAAASATELQSRARQNVVFELGYFCGRLGRNRVAAINKGVEIPSDVDGVAYILQRRTMAGRTPPRVRSRRPTATLRNRTCHRPDQ